MLRIVIDTNRQRWIEGEEDFFYPVPRSFRVHRCFRGVRIRYNGWVKKYEVIFKNKESFLEGYRSFLEQVDFKENIYDVDRCIGIYFKEKDGTSSLVRKRNHSVWVHEPALKICRYICSLDHPKWEEMVKDRRNLVLDELSTHLVEVDDILNGAKHINDILILKEYTSELA